MKGLRQSLTLLERKFHFPVGAGLSVLPSETYGTMHQRSVPAPTIDMMLAIHKYILDPNTSDVMVMIAGAFQYETYAACHTKQAQNMRLEGYDGATWKGRDSADPRCADAALVPAPMTSERINHAIQIML